MTRLLLSVRSVSEAALCIHHGADMIDVKEPLRGALGMASCETIRAIAREVPPRIPVSAALGEWLDWLGEPKLPALGASLAYLKVGLAGAGRMETWREDFGRFCRQMCDEGETYSDANLVAVAYADWKAAEAPRPDEVLDFAAANGFPVILIDTWRKDGLSLLDWLSPEALQSLIERAHAGGLDVALAGSLRLREIDTVLALGPDILAVRGAVCRGGARTASIDPAAVQQIAMAVQAARFPVEAIAG